jgi:hypothetical protein
MHTVSAWYGPRNGTVYAVTGVVMVLVALVVATAVIAADMMVPVLVALVVATAVVAAVMIVPVLVAVVLIAFVVVVVAAVLDLVFPPSVGPVVGLGGLRML